MMLAAVESVKIADRTMFANSCFVVTANTDTTTPTCLFPWPGFRPRTVPDQLDCWFRLRQLLRHQPLIRRSASRRGDHTTQGFCLQTSPPGTIAAGVPAKIIPEID